MLAFGWKGCVGRESVTPFLMVFGNKMVVVVAMVEMMTMVGVIFGQGRRKCSHPGLMSYLSVCGERGEFIN